MCENEAESFQTRTLLIITLGGIRKNHWEFNN